ncbi:beta-glucosidase BglX [Clostridium polynesiense]|uniref:beta-glucosidase BglX n=1 Tax=Clostridium polynesiense TaxID=1325933 RepID=UPI00058F0C0B|nr:beta-glucosidase BglX [Clostridium polynesiense]
MSMNIKDILNKMTIEEKIGQLLQLIPSFYKEASEGEITGPLKAAKLDEKILWNTGSVLGIANAEDMIEIQKKYMENNRHKIPLIFMADVIHGYRTIFPVPLGLSCSWNISLVKKTAEIAAKEAALSGVQVTFSPMVDLVRDPRWGRVMESTGEDTYLNSLFAKAMVEGYQGNLNEECNIAACVKHFAAYGAPEGGREYNTVDISNRNLRENHLPAYKAGVDAGAEMVMTSFNIIDGVPSTCNSKLLRDILRSEWGFDGVVISDWTSVDELINHGVAEDGREAAKKAMEAGVDIEMMSINYVNNLKSLIEDGEISEKLIDDAVLRILSLKNKLGLFENPFRSSSIKESEETCCCEEHLKIAREAAGSSMVLLKNDGVLPLNKERKIALIGPFADEKNILGPWSIYGKPEETVSVLEGFLEKLPKERIIRVKGCDVASQDTSLFKDAIAAAEKADVIVLALGEEESMSGEAGSRADIRLPGVQEKLIHTLSKLNKPMVIVMFNGRPLEITGWYQEASAILEAWFPGTEGGHAVADILFGDRNPSGRLSMSFPYSVGQVPVYYNHFNTGRPYVKGENSRYSSKYLDIPNEPLYPFGYGLGYSEFEYSDLELSSEYMSKGESIRAFLMLKNIGEMEGIETVQLYLRDVAADVARPVKELKAFKQIRLKAGEEKRVEFEIDEEMLKYHDLQGNFKAQKGKFILSVGGDSSKVLWKSFKLI